jgi:3-deoxy-D-manno-octulosonic-acid transferase
MDSVCATYLINLAYGLLLFLTSPIWLFRLARTPQRTRGMVDKLLGRAPSPATAKPVVWFHAVSVGEILLLRPLLAALREKRADYEYLLSTTTSAGYDVAKKHFPALPVFFAPLDFSWSVRRALETTRPRLIVLVELELWPNLLLEAKRRRVPVVVINARLGERSHRGYRRLRWLLRSALTAVRWWGAQTGEYARRITDLVGADAPVEVTGSIKYDGARSDRNNPATQALRRLLGFVNGETVFVAGSTQAPEEEAVLDAFEQLSQRHPALRLVLVPRHPERFDGVAEMIRRRGIAFVRRSQVAAPLDLPARITLVDTMGELSAAWGLADIGFVGGSLGAKRGGQSMIEPAGYGVPVCFGPETWNFQDTVERLLQAGGAVQIGDPDELAPTLARWLERPDDAKEVGRNAHKFIAAQQGALARTLRALDRFLHAE